MFFRSIPSFAALGLFTIALAGCPIWGGDDDYCYDCCYGDCCNGECENPQCSSPSECSAESVCGADNECHSGTCETWGCPFGYVCDDKLTCVPDGLGGGGAGGEGGAGGAGGEGGGIPTSVYCGNPADCAASEHCAPDGTCQTGDCSVDGCVNGFFCNTKSLQPFCDRENPGGCGGDLDCASLGEGFRCVSGACTPAAQLCYDRTQCSAGQVCADGECVASCANAATCPSSYSCDAVTSLCSLPSLPCTITNDCGGADTVCVDGACVPRAVDGLCIEAGTVVVDNGCVPNQARVSVCNVDGTQDLCGTGNICLNQTCYVSCATPNQAACDTLTTDQCKPVTTPFSGPNDVCGFTDNFGTECDLSRSLDCPVLEATCIDGTCVAPPI